MLLCDYSSLRNLRLLHQELLNLTRINIEPTRNNQIAPAPAQRVISIGRLLRNIPSLEPPIHESSLCSLRFLPIPREDIRSFQMKLSGRFLDPERNSRQWKSNRPRPPLPHIGIRNVHERLRHPVTLQNRMAE